MLYLHPLIKNRGERFVQYWPAFFQWGETSTYKRTAYDSQAYRYVSGSYGTGYLCLSSQQVYITSLAEVTKRFPLFPSGTGGFVRGVLLGMSGERNNRKPYPDTYTWMVPYGSIVGAQIATTERQSKIIHLRTTTIDWQITEKFNDTLELMLAGINMGVTGSLATIWRTTEEDQSHQSPSGVVELLKKLQDLKNANIISEDEFTKKKQELLNRL